MTPHAFKEANCTFGPPAEMTDTQVRPIRGYLGTVETGSVEGSQIVVVAYRPSEDEIQALLMGAPIFVSMMGGLAPHFLTTDFKSAINLA